MSFTNFLPDQVDWEALLVKHQKGGQFVGEKFQRGGKNIAEAIAELPENLVRSGLNSIADIAVGKNVLKTLEANGKKVVDSFTGGKADKKEADPIGVLIPPKKRKIERSLLTEQI